MVGSSWKQREFFSLVLSLTTVSLFQQTGNILEAG